MKRIQDLALQDRPREKLLSKGVRVLSNLELLQVIIGSGTGNISVRDIAQSLQKTLTKYDVHNITPDQLKRIPGISSAKVCVLLAAVELVRRSSTHDGHVVRSASDVLPLVSHIRNKKQEHLLAITLDGANTVLTVRTITIGTLTSSLVHPREVFADAISERAASIILVHNHPSGILEPSTEDILATEKLKASGTMLGIPVYDHIIVTKKGYSSLATQGMI